ncbi:MAG: hypothetical protein WAU75_20475 [Solirubrobacteraceae bacterium]
MPTWGEELQELAELQREFQARHTNTLPPPGTESPYDVLRRKYLKALSEQTGRAVIVYATAYLDNKEQVTAADLAVGMGDLQGFMEAVSNVQERQLDLFLHSPGGSPEAAESIMAYLRTRFDHIRAVVPVAAMSAATMMALACDEIVMGAHSQLGPIDPQLSIATPEGQRSAPAQAILDQFEKAKIECQDTKNIAAWLPILRGYGPGLLAMCSHQRSLAEDFATKSLETHMFAGESNAHEQAASAAAWFADFSYFQSHGRRVSREDARAQGIRVVSLEENDDLQDAVLSVHHAVSHTLSSTVAFKLIENHLGRAFLLQKAPILTFAPQIGQGQPGTTPQLPGLPQPSTSGVRGGNRAERRRQERQQRGR